MNPTQQTDPTLAVYLSRAMTSLADKDTDCTLMLERACRKHPDREDLAELLFFAYLREDKLMKMGNQAIKLFKDHEKWTHAMWAIQAMLMSERSLSFET